MFPALRTPVVYRFLLSLCKDASLADELTAETFYQALSARRHVPRRLPRRIMSSARSRKTPSRRSSAAKGAPSPSRKRTSLPRRDDVFELLADKEQAMRIHASLHRLKEPYREVFTLRVLGELHFRDIADLFGGDIQVLGKGHILPRQGQA